MKSLITTICILSLVGMVAGVAVQGANTAPVSATVTPKKISVSVSPSSVAYGTVALDTEVFPTGDPAITATNDGNVTETLNIVGANATFGANTWTLSGTANGADIYMHKFDTPAYADPYTALTTSYQTLAASVASSGTQDFKLKIKTPVSTLAYGEYSTTVTIQATE